MLSVIGLYGISYTSCGFTKRFDTGFHGVVWDFILSMIAVQG